MFYPKDKGKAGRLLGALPFLEQIFLCPVYYLRAVVASRASAGMVVTHFPRKTKQTHD